VLAPERLELGATVLTC